MYTGQMQCSASTPHGQNKYTHHERVISSLKVSHKANGRALK